MAKCNSSSLLAREFSKSTKTDLCALYEVREILAFFYCPFVQFEIAAVSCKLDLMIF